ncbi:hypothetical protein [Marmoricola sp. URHB0036]|uniref:hypothetical protein n=1 Tax=Marmoricola sp. URHB0036 TaxID=1298863 RepID=UPI000406D955|nr:hypothetical protein [Marmoricola sp. URHB0036]
MKQPTPSATEQATTLGVRLAHAVADRDATRLCSLFATPVVFRAVTPRRFFDAETPMGVVDIVLGVWFDPSKTVTGLVDLETGIVADVERVSYRIEVEIDGRPAVIEQVAYYSHVGGQITQLRLVCSGFRAV